MNPLNTKGRDTQISRNKSFPLVKKVHCVGLIFDFDERPVKPDEHGFLSFVLLRKSKIVSIH